RTRELAELVAGPRRGRGRDARPSRRRGAEGISRRLARDVLSDREPETTLVAPSERERTDQRDLVLLVEQPLVEGAASVRVPGGAALSALGRVEAAARAGELTRAADDLCRLHDRDVDPATVGVHRDREVDQGAE